MSKPDPNGVTILMVDDNATNLQVLFKTLQQTGHRLLAARSGEEALDTARKVHPDLILLDIMMPPGIDGYETIQRLKDDEALRETPVIFLSSLNDTCDKVRGLELGAVDYVSKPFQAEEVIARVNTHLTIRQLQADLAERNEQLACANQRMKDDLDAAGRVQQALLPDISPEADGYEFGWLCRSCDELGGDAIDLFRINDDTVGFYLLDVSGHGVPASLLAVSTTRSLTPRSNRSSVVTEFVNGSDNSAAIDPGKVLNTLNLLNPMDEQSNPHFITGIYGLLCTRTGLVRYACAGHPGPIVVRRDGTSEIRDGGSLPIGLMPNTQYDEMTIQLTPGDRLFVHSDGLNEQMNEQGTMWGRDRLRDTLARPAATLQEHIEETAQEVEAWAAPKRLSDDVSLIAIGHNP